jgi:hypothetical protein
MKVTRSGYYAWRKQEPGPRQKANELLLPRIKMYFDQSKQT